MAYTYRNKKTGEVIHLNHHAKSVFWEEVEPEQEEDFEEDSEQEDPGQEDPEQEEPVEEPPKKTGRGRGKKA